VVGLSLQTPMLPKPAAAALRSLRNDN
jgi:hypothetical protein